MSTTIVVADVNVSRRQAVIHRLGTDTQSHECTDGKTLLHILARTVPAVVVIGSLGSCAEVIDAANLVRTMHPAAKVIVIADISSEGFAIDALRAGVFEYLKSPIEATEILRAIYRAAPPAEEHLAGFESLVGSSRQLRDIRSLIHKVAPLNSTVLITGESGTGKEVVARLIHEHSLRSRAPFVCVNCAAIPDSLVESELFGHERGAFTGAVSRQNGQMKNADGGTLFLDEIGDMTPLAQSKMLRTLEQREIQPLGSSRPVSIDVRVIAATHRDLEQMVAEEKFRGDLYYRLDVSRIHIPPLRERAEDIPALATHLLRHINRENGGQIEAFTADALETLGQHHWPGNIRQLRNVIEAAAAICTSSRISDQDLRALHSFSVSGPAAIKRAAISIPTRKAQPDKDALLETLERTRWNMTKTAELLSWSRSTLYRNLARYNIDRNEPATDTTNATPGQHRRSASAS